MDACESCQERERQATAEVARLGAMWRARECAADDCKVLFTPAATQQRFCSDRCRKRTHARLKARLAQELV